MAYKTKVILAGAFILLYAFPLPIIMAAEIIPDKELANLYGGCWFDNPRCIVGGSSCPAHTSCDQLNKCRFCTSTIPQQCQDHKSYWPDLDGCDSGLDPCGNAGGVPGQTPCGFCVYVECEEDYCTDPPYPDCDSDWYNWCDD